MIRMREEMSMPDSLLFVRGCIGKMISYGNSVS